MQTTTILLSGTALIASFGIGYQIAKARWIGMWEIADGELSNLLRKRAETDKAAANIKVERDHFEKSFKAAIKDLDLAISQRDDVRTMRDQTDIALRKTTEERDAAVANAESERTRANSLQQELTAERAKPKAAPIAEMLQHGAASKRETLKPRYEKPELTKIAISAPKAEVPSSPLETRIRKLVTGLPEIESEKLANTLSTKELKGNRLRLEIKPIMAKLGFEQLRGVSRPGKRAKVRVWRRKK